ncbi:hypothetical protein GCM10022232_93480 [Streptomyces plumbiresistens]|uniref:Uncharacterized protein n=1 Tax=Streptomyces plumbiresistens TaxID=511811 RepID=A0ABP7TYD6_9ACTN
MGEEGTGARLTVRGHDRLQRDLENVGHFVKGQIVQQASQEKVDDWPLTALETLTSFLREGPDLLC